MLSLNFIVLNLIVLCACSFLHLVRAHRFTEQLPPDWSNQGNPDGYTHCEPDKHRCEFSLNVQQWLVLWDKRTPVFAREGQLYANGKTEAPLNVSVITSADGVQTLGRRVLLYNGTLPGPELHVYQGQEVLVHVTNQLATESTSVHWHGLHQRNFPEADGVPFVTQCPILPGQTFTYRFVADLPGSFWYHSHIGSQRTDGLNGAFITHERMRDSPPEHVVMISEWNHDFDSTHDFLRMIFGFYTGSVPNAKMFMGNPSFKASRTGMFMYHSVLINGRGRCFDAAAKAVKRAAKADDARVNRHAGGKDEQTEPLQEEEAESVSQSPLTLLPVVRGRFFLLRLVTAGTFPQLVMLDQHSFTVIASDGHFLEPTVADGVLVSPGERVDVLVSADHEARNYWLRAQNLESDGVRKQGLAVIRYVTEGSSTAPEVTSEAEPASSQPRACTAGQPCRIVNCPFRFFPKHWNMECVSSAQLRRSQLQNYSGYLQKLRIASNMASARPPQTEAAEILPDEEHMLNFGFPGDLTWAPASVNGRSFRAPSVAALFQRPLVHTGCDVTGCGRGKVCACTNILKVSLNSNVQLVFTNFGVGEGFAHPIHLHGYHFRVMRIGWPTYNQTSGEKVQDNQDIDCSNDTYCNAPRWRNPEWSRRGVPGLVPEQQAPVKDTVTVPSGGYVVVRFRSDNPGLWLLHCHLDSHSRDGMAILLDIASELASIPPVGFPLCGNVTVPKLASSSTQQNENTSSYSAGTFWLAVGSLSAVNIVLILVLALQGNFRDKAKPRRSRYTKLPVLEATEKETMFLNSNSGDTSPRRGEL